MLPLIVLDCSRSLNAMPAVGVRCKALNNRADALEEIDEDTSLMQAICDMDVAIRVAAAQLSSADATLKAIIFGFSNGIAVIRCGSHRGLLCGTNRTCANAASAHAEIFCTSSNIRSAG